MAGNGGAGFAAGGVDREPGPTQEAAGAAGNLDRVFTPVGSLTCLSRRSVRSRPGSAARPSSIDREVASPVAWTVKTASVPASAWLAAGGTMIAGSAAQTPAAQRHVPARARHFRMQRRTMASPNDSAYRLVD